MARKVKKFVQEESSEGEYTVASEKLGVDDKLKILDSLGRSDLVDLFKDWKPRTSNRKKKGAPLDQRVSITVTDAERLILDNELKNLKSSGEKISMSQFIRNKCIGNIDINGWRDKAEKALTEIEDIAAHQKELRNEKNQLLALSDNEDDEEEIFVYEKKISEINQKLQKIVAQNEKRSNRLSGRMSMQESEVIKWRAQRLCISTSDYLRMMIFNLEPDSKGDSHMSLDGKRRFYISIIDVADNGFGEPPTIYNCSQCENYLDEIYRLRERIRQLETFV